MKVAFPLTAVNSFYQVRIAEALSNKASLVVEIISTGSEVLLVIMSEKLCLQWNDFKENVNSAFGSLRNDKVFTDVTLVCEDGQQMEAHKVILASSSPFFEKILQNSKHPNPLIYLRGYHSKDFVSILDFLYFGEANVFQEDLDSFLAIAEEIQLKGLTGQNTTTDLVEERENSVYKRNDEVKISTSRQMNPKAKFTNTSTSVAIPREISADLQALDEKIKSLMEKGTKMIPYGKQANGTPRQETSCICKVCGKEGLLASIRNHIEAHHLEGICIPCGLCDKTFSSRNALRKHKSYSHK